MVNYYIYAKDFSGSTGGSKYFHTIGLQTLDQFKSHVRTLQKETPEETESKIIYLHWGDKCYEVSEESTKSNYENLNSGNMGTEPETIIEWIKKNCDISDENDKINLLYIITDGIIDRRSGHTCFLLNENMHYETVVFHAINEYFECVDLSVAASFLKSRCIIYRNNELFDDANISKVYEYSKINVDNFVTEKDSLKSYIRLKYINRFKHDALALQEIERLKKLRNQLFDELSRKLQKSDINLNTKDKKAFVKEFLKTDWYKNLNGSIHDMKVDIEKCISTLINYITSDTKSYSFDALKFDTKFNKPIEEEPIVDVNFTTEQEIEFPDVILDDEKGIPVIILTELNLLDKIIFHKTKDSSEVSPASFNKFKTAMECPLFLYDDHDISESIGYFYTLNVYKQFLENGIRSEPRTRRPFHGGLVLLDGDEFDKYNDYILSATYFNFKKIKYNIGLFYYVLWKNCENKKWMDTNVIEQFKKYVMRRISTTECKIGLSSLPLDPPETTPLLTALWYCVELSSVIFKDNILHFTHERLRMFYGVAHCMIEILQYFDYNLDLEFIERRRDIIRHVMILKKIPKQCDKVYYLLERIFKNVNGFLVSEIERPSNINKLNYLKLDHKGMLSDDVSKENVNLNDFVHLMHTVIKNTKERPKICNNTYRPYFTLDKHKSFYTELFNVTRKAVIHNAENQEEIKITFEPIDSLEFDKILSLYNLFIKCVNDSEKYPTLEEYIEYIHRKKKFNDNLVTIFPSVVYDSAVKVFELYQNIISTVDVKTFIKTTRASVSRFERIKTEQVIKFSDDNEINAFIDTEELKVNLKKVK
ncbi:uncharacterized protein LOC121733780 [Aricia agestis]|uniref:uncharacterized protein LOC121733780 n=1 Tax=Aricia agestis TaxID=91739 RepID=UPI001C20568C|nr:uncharacterized protein LOC121733780 [Aricia agestis]